MDSFRQVIRTDLLAASKQKISDLIVCRGKLFREQTSLDSNLLDARALGRILGLNRQTIYKLARDGDLPSIKISRKARRFEKSTIARWLKAKATT
jgi:excisionase family DNA binding protein